MIFSLRSVFLFVFVLFMNGALLGQFDSVVYYYNQNNFERSIAFFQKVDTVDFSAEKMYSYFLHGATIYLQAGSYNKTLDFVKAGRDYTGNDREKEVEMNLIEAKTYSYTGKRQQIERIMDDLDTYVENYGVDSAFYLQYLFVKVRYNQMAANYREAMANAVKLLKYIDHSGKSREMGSIYLSIGEIFRVNQRLKKALHYYEKAEELAREVNDLGLIAQSYNNQAIIYMELGDTVTSIDMLHESIFFHKQSGGYSGAASAQYNLGWLYLEGKEYALAKKQFRKVIDLGERHGFQMAMYFGYFGVGMYYNYVGGLDDAEYYFFKALEIAKQNNNISGIGRIYESLSKLYQKYNRFEKALFYSQQDTHLRDSIKMEEQKSLVEGLEAKYNLELKEKENKELKLQQAEQKATIARQKLSFFVTGAIVVLLFFLLAFFYVVIRNKEKKNRFLEAQRKSMEHKNMQLQNLNDEVIEQKAQLEEINHIKDSMFSIISHDLRSPLSSVFMLMKMFEQGNVDQGRGVGMLKELSSEVSQSLFLLNNLLTWANINLKGVQPDLRSVQLDGVFRESLDFFQSEISRKNITFNYSVDPNILVSSDEFMLKSIVQNLISNAVKFSYEGTTVSVRSVEHSGKIILTIVNEGAELDQKMVDEVFVPGVRLGKGTKNERGGGLGLTIVSIYTNAIGGSIDFKSKNNTNIMTLKMPSA